MTGNGLSFHEELDAAVASGLDTTSTISGEADAARAGASPRGRDSVPPPPPPPPVRSRQELKAGIKADRRELQRSWLADAVARAGRFGRFWRYAAIGVFIALVLAYVFPWIVAKITSAAATGAQAGLVVPQQTSRGPVVREPSMPNPLKRVQLTPQAATYLGAYDSDRDGRMDSYDLEKSADVVLQLLQSMDLCGWWLNIVTTTGDNGDMQLSARMSQQFTPGAAQLAACPTPSTTTTTAATVPSTTTTAAALK